MPSSAHATGTPTIDTSRQASRNFRAGTLVPCGVADIRDLRGCADACLDRAATMAATRVAQRLYSSRCGRELGSSGAALSVLRAAGDLAGFDVERLAGG